MDSRMLERFGAPAAERLAPLVRKQWRALLAEADPDGEVIVVGSALLGQPVACGLAVALPDQGTAWVHSLGVAQAFRGRGIGTMLLARLEEEIARAGTVEARLAYPPGKPSSPVIERILEKRGWAKPEPYLVYCRCQGEDVRRLMQAPWMAGAPLPPGFEFFPWAQLPPAERERLRRQHAGAPIWEEDLDPFRGREEIEPASSVGLRYRGEVIGWCLTQRAEPGVARFANLFVRREFRKMARGAALLAESIRRHVAQNGQRPDCGGVWQTLAENAPMVRFIQRRLGPYLTEMGESWGSCKVLGKAPSGEVSP